MKDDYDEGNAGTLRGWTENVFGLTWSIRALSCPPSFPFFTR
jgi:hypothetical protein